MILASGDVWVAIGAFGQWAAALIAVGGLYFIYRQVKTATDEARRDRTAAVHVQWADREFRRLLTLAYAYLSVDDLGDCLAKIRAWKLAAHAELACLPRSLRDEMAPMACKNDVTHVLTFCEDLCLRYNLGEIDPLSVALSIGPQLLGLFLDAAWFIYWQRALNGDTVYGELEATVKELWRGSVAGADDARHRHVLAELTEGNPTFPLRAVCAPPKDGSIRAGTAEELSRALAPAIGRLTPTERVALSVTGTAEDALQTAAGWNVVLMPRSFEDRAWDPAAMYRLAAGLAHRLDELQPAAVEAATERLQAGDPIAAALR